VLPPQVTVGSVVYRPTCSVVRFTISPRRTVTASAKKLASQATAYAQQSLSLEFGRLLRFWTAGATGDLNYCRHVFRFFARTLCPMYKPGRIPVSSSGQTPKAVSETKTPFGRCPRFGDAIAASALSVHRTRNGAQALIRSIAE